MRIRLWLFLTSGLTLFLPIFLPISSTTHAQTSSCSPSSSARQSRTLQIKPAVVIPAQVKPAQVKPGGIVPAGIIPGGPGKTPQIIPPKITAPEVKPPEVKPAEVIPAEVYITVKETPTETRITLPADVLFDFDKSSIRPDAEANLAQILPYLKDGCTRSIRIEGHTDSMGSDSYNQTLSEQRAAAVKIWLSQHAIAESLSTQGFGESRPVAPNTNPDGSDDPSGRQKNRRVELIVQR